MSRQIEESYKKIYTELISALKSDFSKCLTEDQIEYIEQNWRKKLEESKLFVADMDYTTLSFRLSRSVPMIIPTAPNPEPHTKREVEASPPPSFTVKQEPKTTQIAPSPKEEPEFLEPEVPEIVSTPPPKEEVKEQPQAAPSFKFDFNIPNDPEPVEHLQKRGSFDDSESDDLFNDEPAPSDKRVKTGMTTELIQRERDQIAMREKVEEAMKPKLEQEAKQEQQNITEDPLNSADDDLDYEKEVVTGNNILVGYYEKADRKKNKRKMIFRNCILRINSGEWIVPYAKGDFIWEPSHEKRR